MKKLFCIMFTLHTALCLFILAPAQANAAGFAIQPSLVQHLLTLAQVPAEVVENSPDLPFPTSVFIPELAGSSVTIGFPSAGIQQQAPFYLEIDGAAATVMVDAHNGLAIIDGDRAITATGIFSVIQCILSSILSLIDSILYELLHLDILGVITAIFEGIRWIINCIFQIFT